MNEPIMGRALRPVTIKKTCDFDGAGHNKIIAPGKPAYRVVTGDAQGQYHSMRCYQAALAKYRDLKKKHNL